MSDPHQNQKFRYILKKNLTDDEWENIYCLPFLTTIESKLRIFQISINHFYYFTNERLVKSKIKESPACSFCNASNETIVHLFIECSHVAPLWTFFHNIFQRIEPIGNLTNFQKLFGLHDKMREGNHDLINHIILTIKYYIHLCRTKKDKPIKPSLSGLKKRISYTEYLEKQIATKKQKLEAHE